MWSRDPLDRQVSVFCQGCGGLNHQSPGKQREGKGRPLRLRGLAERPCREACLVSPLVRPELDDWQWNPTCVSVLYFKYELVQLKINTSINNECIESYEWIVYMYVCIYWIVLCIARIHFLVGVFSVRTSDVGRATSKLSDSRRIWTFRAPLFQPDKIYIHRVVD